MSSNLIDVFKVAIPQKGRMKALARSIISKLEAYFFDCQEASKPEWLKTLLQNHQEDAYISLEEISKFDVDIVQPNEKLRKRLKQLSKKSKIIEFNGDGTALKARNPVICNANNCGVYVDNIPFDADEEWIREALKSYGPILLIQMPKAKTTNAKLKNRGFCFVYYSEPEIAEKIVTDYRELHAKVASSTLFKHDSSKDNEKTLTNKRLLAQSESQKIRSSSSDADISRKTKKRRTEETQRIGKCASSISSCLENASSLTANLKLIGKNDEKPDQIKSELVVQIGSLGGADRTENDETNPIARTKVSPSPSKMIESPGHRRYNLRSAGSVTDENDSVKNFSSHRAKKRKFGEGEQRNAESVALKSYATDSAIAASDTQSIIAAPNDVEKIDAFVATEQERQQTTIKMQGGRQKRGRKSEDKAERNEKKPDGDRAPSKPDVAIRNKEYQAGVSKTNTDTPPVTSSKRRRRRKRSETDSRAKDGLKSLKRPKSESAEREHSLVGTVSKADKREKRKFVESTDYDDQSKRRKIYRDDEIELAGERQRGKRRRRGLFSKKLRNMQSKLRRLQMMADLHIYSYSEWAAMKQQYRDMQKRNFSLLKQQLRGVRALPDWKPKRGRDKLIMTAAWINEQQFIQKEK